MKHFPCFKDTAWQLLLSKYTIEMSHITFTLLGLKNKGTGALDNLLWYFKGGPMKDTGHTLEQSAWS